MATIQAEARAIDNGNGHQVASGWYHPAGTPRGAVLMASAMAVKQDFYAHFASWLAERGFLVVTFDYLGMGQSRHVPLRQLDVDILDWARHDCSAVLAKVAEAVGDLPLYWIGHSVGAQILPLVNGHERLARIVTIAAGSGYWRENSPQIRPKAWLLWHGLAPLLTSLVGYFQADVSARSAICRPASCVSGVAGACILSTWWASRANPCAAPSPRCKHR